MVKDHRVIVNIYNFIRKTVYPSGIAAKEELDTVLYEIEEVKRQGFSGTYALKYDALMDERYVSLLKENLDEVDEIGFWFEVDESLAKKAGVRWKGSTPVDDHVNKGYSLAYNNEERKKMIDVYMNDFKDIFGYYPKSVGSWVLDIVTLTYLKEKYFIEAAVICRDQIGTDGFTLSGGYYNQAYYPSKVNEFIPAQSKEMQIDLPVFRLLGSDPIYAFEDGLRKSVQGVYTLEPAATIAQDEEWIKWFFDRLIEESTIGFAYAQTGQENTFLWNTMEKGYELQMAYIKELEDENLLKVETLLETARWYKKKYKLTPVATTTVSKDWNEENLKTLWYNSRFYRVSFLFEKGILTIRDLHLFDENYKSRYLNDILIEEESIFDSLPFLNSHSFSNNEKRAEINFLRADNINEFIKGKNILFEKINDSDYKVALETNLNEIFEVVTKENSIEFNLKNTKKEQQFYFVINNIPVLDRLEGNRILLKHNNFNYEIYVDNGSFVELEGYPLAISSENSTLILRFSKEKNLTEYSFLKTNSEQSELEIHETRNFDEINKSTNINKKKKDYKVRAKKPIINPSVIMKAPNERGTFTIENKNILGEIYYTLDGSEPNEKSTIYKKPIILDKETTIKARVIAKGMKDSIVTKANFYQGIEVKAIEGNSVPVDIEKYNPKGILGLIDKIRGTDDYRDGSYLGYHQDLDVILDLGEVKEINRIEAGFLQDTRAWIYYPKDLLFQGSIDKKSFEDIEYINCDKSLERKEVALENIKVNKKMNYRYIRVFARNQKLCPDWSITANEGPAFLFIDQILIN
ncbi:MAG: chitobiase/beta-hexosaminidase C-terminal domain-containing protein [Sarcina sp.]